MLNKMIWGWVVIFCLCFIGEISSFSGVSFDEPGWSFINPGRNFSACLTGEYWKGRVPWIILNRDADFGWKQHTHRGNIALAVNRYQGMLIEIEKTRDQEILQDAIQMDMLLDWKEEKRKMGQQLELEITKALFRNVSTRIHENDLALMINALLANNRNPRDFYGNDLVNALLHRVQDAAEVHPFLTLALCNSQVITYELLRKIRRYTNDTSHSHDGRVLELKALALKTFACAKNLSSIPSLKKFDLEMKQASDCLTQSQKPDGSFGNVYTTSLAVQALIASDSKDWDEVKALEYLTREAYINVNMIKAYYIEMALNAKHVKFIKDLYTSGKPKPYDPPSPPDNRHYIQYTIMKGIRTDYYFTITIKVRDDESFFDVMTRAQKLSDKFDFKYFNNTEDLPIIYSVAGTPNDAEENMFWRVCRQYDVNHDSHNATTVGYHNSPAKLLPYKDEHITLSYMSYECRSHT